MNHSNPKNNELKQGVIIFIVLAVLTAFEYVLSILQAPTLTLVLIAILKAAAVIWYFMHLKRAFRADEGEHS